MGISPPNFGGYSVVVDNIATLENCQGLARTLRKNDIHGSAVCVAVRKVLHP